MIVGKKYASCEVNTQYDAIVIGSGLGGLTTAALLAKAGQKVLVLERHYTAGGFTHSFKRRGYEWDVGVHYIGEVHKTNSTLRRVFDLITDSQLQWAKMDDNYDKIIIKDRQYNFVAGAANFRDELLKSFPNGKTQIDAYLSHIRAATRSMPAHFGQRYLPPRLQPLFGKFMPRNDYFGRTTKAVMADFIQDPKLASVLCGQWGDYGLPPGQSSFAMHAIVAQHYLGGASFPVGGASQIARHIVPVIERAGGAVLVQAEVEQIMVDGGRAIGVRMSNGDEILCRNVISAAGVINTFGKLLPEEVGTRLQLQDKLSHVKPSVSHLGLYLGVKGSAADLQLEQANMWLYRDYDHDKSLAKFLKKPNTDFPLNYISFPSSKDPAWDQHYAGKSTIDVISLAPYEWFKKWENQPWKNRGAEYDDFKQTLAQKLLEDVYQQVPQVRGKVDYYELSTPLSTKHFNHYGTGEVYGLDHTPERFAQSWVKPRTPIKGLHLTGQDILFCGVASAMMSGVMTATSVLGAASVQLLTEFIPKEQQWLRSALETIPFVKPTRSARPAAREKLATPAPQARKLQAKCLEVLNITHDVKAFRFVVQKSKTSTSQALAYLPGQFVTLEVKAAGKTAFRSYTIASSPDNADYFELIVKRVDAGVVSNWLCDEFKVGMVLAMNGPHGQFTCAPKPRKKLLLLSAGSGVTPMLSMARWLRDQGMQTDVVFFHSARTQADLMFADEVAAMTASNPQFAQHISLTRNQHNQRNQSKPKRGSKSAPVKTHGAEIWQGLTGHFDAAMLRTIAPDFAEREVYICGPEGFMAGSKQIFQHAGFNMIHFHEESFGSTNNDAVGGSVEFADSGIELECSGQQNLLELAEQAGIVIANACRTGDCGECKVRKEAGQCLSLNSAGLDAHEVEQDYVLACVSFVNGGKVRLAA